MSKMKIERVYSLNREHLEFKFKLRCNPNSLDFLTGFRGTRTTLLKDDFTRKLDNLENFRTREEKRNILSQTFDPNNDT